MSRQFYVYIMTNRSRTLYVGVTNDLLRRVFEHRSKQIAGFTRQYNIMKLVYFEETPNVLGAIKREKQIKGWLRSRKLALIESFNPDWCDLSEAWFQAETGDPSLRSG